ncbi:MAG: hypothetical protein ACRYF2_07410 [Janthinobacterium lividum]
MIREPFTGREHLALGRRLYSMHDQLTEIALVLQDGYGKTLMRKADRVDRALTALTAAGFVQAEYRKPGNRAKALGLRSPNRQPNNVDWTDDGPEA